ncbi:MAG: hypothetical protein NTW33_00780 [Methanoregula sp.]|nr:hypothetical protein [Methanoregula sp.]
MEAFFVPLPPYLPLTDTDLADTRDVPRTSPDINELVRRAAEAGAQGLSPAAVMGSTNELAAYVKK